jgi:hypothetical protein
VDHLRGNDGIVVVLISQVAKFILQGHNNLQMLLYHQLLVPKQDTLRVNASLEFFKRCAAITSPIGI